jgi:hypothetical protein
LVPTIHREGEKRKKKGGVINLNGDIVGVVGPALVGKRIRKEIYANEIGRGDVSFCRNESSLFRRCWDSGCNYC